MDRRILITASLFGAIAVMLGAFGAHGLRNVLDAGSIEIWTKGVEYQFYHTFALLFLAQLKSREAGQGKFINLAYVFFTFGILLFSGSLYLLATRSITNNGFVNYIGPVTPIGGLLLILGWLSLLLAALKSK
ncbi:DUF423 domain-containing protein [Pedobacter sp. V48]|uniref:DUF423 domain-containing protein n=1 Tax=Pedobacter sp. V48 TaxID=509635 RepID=UPI0003E452D4|nr:DUF423 domain-containing protein [Pedobacter sp. V48]ETZ21098.1 hypothetical protein N824_02990 [Pedobacter sp. V48]